jgi:phosphoribosyl 1,2-cyclic phosphate phosphodiesterase
MTAFPGRIRLEMLGSGASFGVPVIGCSCPTCTSSDPHDLRARSSVRLQWEDVQVVVDSGPDFRMQCLRSGIARLDAIWYTHAHADHTAGLDDLRPFCRPDQPLLVRAQSSTLDELSRRHAYAFRNDPNPFGVSKPTLRTLAISGPFEECGRRVTPIPVKHGPFDVLGFRVGNLAYITDVNEIPPSSMELLEGLEVLILSGLRPKPHPTHFHLEAAVEVSRVIGARRTILTHLAHDLTHRQLCACLPEGIEAGWDGLTVEIPL